MKFTFSVKHNGIIYEAGTEVPIGKEPIKENEEKEMTVNEIREELRKLGVKSFPSNKKADLIKLLEEKKAESSKVVEEETEEDEGEEPSDGNIDVTDDIDSTLPSTELEEETEEDESDLLDSIVNE